MERIDKNFLEESAEQETSAAMALLEEEITQSKEMARENEAEMWELIRHLKFQPEAIEAENAKEDEQAEIFARQAEETLQTRDLDIEILGEEELDQFILETQRVVGGKAGHYWDTLPFHAWGRVYKHNEGGVTQGSATLIRSERKMFLYAKARGAGLGITDDNDVTVYGKFYYAFYPRNIGTVRVYVPVTTRGWYQLRSNDKWWNSKEAKARITLQIRLYQNFWGPIKKRRIFSRGGGNISAANRIDRYQSIYSDPMSVGANRWVFAEVTCKLRVETEGSGTLSVLSFRRPDCIYVPGVRFEFA
ncbi:hypothetical protein [Thermodesulfatator atlanticus]|uniref:hypothetical protein n=1 Tax=Thermodesulfatator atlanticus TaxID=501497 RepID=UPI0003B6FB43|nr:hypothetical protein [Thermodesulfatator atlanticus]